MQSKWYNVCVMYEVFFTQRNDKKKKVSFFQTNIQWGNDIINNLRDALIPKIMIYEYLEASKLK